jgi:hypothetical protein
LKTARRSPNVIAIALALTLTLLLTLFSPSAPSLAQDDTTVFAPGVSVNRTYVSQIESALAATDLTTLQAGATAALGTGRSLVSVLESIATTATDDAIRSRAEGLLRHVEASQSALESALTQTEFDAARSELDSARGEAFEALSEILPFETSATAAATAAPAVMPTVAAATELPATGSPSPLLLVPFVVVGLVLLALGNRLRRA